MGLNYSMTGVFYNKTLAAKIGMTTPPATLAEFDALLAKAKAAGITPIVQFNGGATGGLLFPLQDLMARLRAAGADQRLDLPEAGRDHRHAVATSRRRSTCSSGSRPATSPTDANAIDYPTMMSKFQHGEGLFMFNGDWESGNLDKQMPGNVGFFLMPPLKAGGKHAAMSAPLTFGIAAKAKHADCAAFFLNWVATNAEGAQDRRHGRRLEPRRARPNLPIPAVKPGTVTGADARGRARSSPRTTARWTSSRTPPARSTRSRWTPRCRSCSPASRRPRACSKAVQADYEKQVKG